MQAGDLRIGTTFEMDGAVWTVLDFQHVQQPRLAPLMKTKIKNIETGQVLEKRFKVTEKLGSAFVEKKDMQFLYQDGSIYYFMDTENYEQLALDGKIVEEAMPFIKEGAMVNIHSALNRVIAVIPPIFVELKIVKCEPGVAGDTAKSAYKPAELETGLVVKVPLFVNNEETIKVDTRTSEYVERVS